VRPRETQMYKIELTSTLRLSLAFTSHSSLWLEQLIEGIDAHTSSGEIQA